MEREFFYLFAITGRPGVYRIGITNDLKRETAEGGLGLDPSCRHRPKRQAGTVTLLASCWVGAEAPAFRSRLLRLLGRPAGWGNAQLELSQAQLDLVLEEALAAARTAVRVPAGFVTGRPEWDWEDALNEGLEEAAVAVFSASAGRGQAPAPPVA
jgi:hypothetical protein